MEAVLQNDLLDGTAHRITQEVGGRRRDDVVLGAREHEAPDTRCCRDRLRPRSSTPLEERQRRLERGAVYASSADPGLGDVRSDAGCDRLAGLEHPWRSCRGRLWAGGSTIGLTTAMPRISGCCSANQQVRVPPIESPTTTTGRTSSRDRSNAPSAAADQSLHRLSSRSLISVPCPGKRGRSTAKPRLSESFCERAHRLGVAREPVKHEAPRRRRRCEKGSAPCITGCVTSPHATGPMAPSWSHAGPTRRH